MLCAFEAHLSPIFMLLSLSGCPRSSGCGVPAVPLPPSHPPNLLSAPPWVLWKLYDDFISIACGNDLFYFSRGICIQIGKTNYIFYYIHNYI